MNLVSTLRMYAEDMHSATGYSERSSAMSKAADMIEKFENMSACEACATIPSVMEYVQQLEQERDNLAAQNKGMREAIELYFKQYPHRMKGYILDALNPPNLASEVLKRRDAEVLRRAADRFEAVDPHPKHWDWLRRNAAEIEGEMK